MEHKPCLRRKCIYRAQKDAFNRCNYALITGKTRLAQLPPDLRSPHLCPLYVKGERLNVPREQISLTGSRPLPDRVPRHEARYNWDAALEMHSKGMSDKDIASALGCSLRSVRNWKRRIKENDM